MSLEFSERLLCFHLDPKLWLQLVWKLALLDTRHGRCGFRCRVLSHACIIAHAATSVPVLLLGLNPACSCPSELQPVLRIAEKRNSLYRTLDVAYKYLSNLAH